MKRPSKAGLLVLLAFSIPVIVELRTVLAMVGIDIPLGTYLLVSGVGILLAFIAIILAPPREGNPNRRADSSA